MLFKTSFDEHQDQGRQRQARGRDAQHGRKRRPCRAGRQGGPRTGPISRGYTEEIEHWAWCIKNPSSDDKPRCNPEVALGDAVIALTTNQVVREERPVIEFEDEWFDIDNDETPEGERPDTTRKDYAV